MLYPDFVLSSPPFHGVNYASHILYSPLIFILFLPRKSHTCQIWLWYLFHREPKVLKLGLSSRITVRRIDD